MKKLKVGDVLELDGKSGKIFLHYLGNHPGYCEAVLVCPTEYPDSTRVEAEIFNDGYFIFFPAGTAVRKGLARVVGNFQAPELPSRLRRPFARSRNGEIMNWVIEDGGGKTLAVRDVLSPSEKLLPLAVIWDLEALRYEVSQGWRPEMER